MKKKLIIANWKSYKTKQEAHDWLKVFIDITSNNKFEGKEIILCPSFTLLPYLHTWITNHQIALSLGAQDISPFSEGPYTGEVNRQQIKEFAEYVIVGHSERRQYFGENDAFLTKKIAMAKEAGLAVIFCVQGRETGIPNGAEIVAYEPVFAIGSGNPDTPENANDLAKEIKTEKNIKTILYGGSVTPENVNQFTSKEQIDGVLVGSASLDPHTFAALAQNA